MSILIKGLEMPQSCMSCRFHDNGTIDEWEMFCEITHEYVGNWDDKKWQKGWKPKNCPLVELPPHGRLIDADAFELDECHSCDGACDVCECDCLSCKDEHRCSFMQDLHDAPTIIEAETCNNSSETCNKSADDAVNASIGRWISHEGYKGATWSFYECPVCNEKSWRKYNFCPNCGARMVEE